MPDNFILTGYAATGCADATAAQDGIDAGGPAASGQMANTDWGRASAIKVRFDAAGAEANLPAALIAAVASRESRCGNVLRDGWGDGGNAFGIMQVDKRFHVPAGVTDPKSQAHIGQATGIPASFLAQMQIKFADQAAARQLQAAVAAYDCGAGRAASPDTADAHTTDGDYSNDVWARAAFYLTKW
jgi:hypothetical protein